jgi:2-polyprenyl-3-methyl-5-hydroxy-6-metoxy-1,4-benzoquinol methylase
VASTRSRVRYLLNSTRKLLTRQGLACPSCGHADSTIICRKYLVTALRRCRACHLLFRAPTTLPDENRSFYQSEYSQGFTTDMPTAEQLGQLTQTQFRGSEKDYTAYIDILKALGARPGARLFDYGCSWGYGSWQFAQAGFAVTAFEISLPRADYAKTHLNVDVHTATESVRGPFDIFFSAHVLEHVPSIADSIRLARTLVKDGGWFVALTPNGAAARRAHHPEGWMQWWGQVHPNFLDDEFYRHAFRADPHLLASSPYDLTALAQWAARPAAATALDLSGSELLVVARLTAAA